jgi:hypothetical protein
MRFMTTTVESTQPRVRRRRLSPGLILILGVVVAPTLIGLTTGEYGAAPDAHDYVRMAFAFVAAQTIAVLTALGVLVEAIVRRSGALAIFTSGLIFLVIASSALSGVTHQAEQLVRVLSAPR